jgi:NAD(P)H-dependent flavin oxidoreductase YrpB (nitropropane dioxygenase family)
MEVPVPVPVPVVPSGEVSFTVLLQPARTVTDSRESMMTRVVVFIDIPLLGAGGGWDNKCNVNA